MKTEKEIRTQLKSFKSRYYNVLNDPINNAKKWDKLVKLSLKVKLLTWILR